MFWKESIREGVMVELEERAGRRRELAATAAVDILKDDRGEVPCGVEDQGCGILCIVSTAPSNAGDTGDSPRAAMEVAAMPARALSGSTRSSWWLSGSVGGLWVLDRGERAACW